MPTTKGDTMSEQTGTGRKRPPRAAESDEVPTAADVLAATQAAEGALDEVLAGDPAPGSSDDLSEAELEREDVGVMPDGEVFTPPAGPGPVALSAELPADLMEGLSPAVAAILAAQSAQTQQLLGVVADLVSTVHARSGSAVEAQVRLEGSVESLVKELSGTVTDGGDGDDPLETPVTFVSKGKMFCAVKKSRYRGQAPDGSHYFTTGVHADFAPSGSFTTRNREMVEWLKARPGYRVMYWDVGNEPFTAPDPNTMLDSVMDAMMSLDDARLEEMETQERASHQRKVVLDAIKSARAKVQAFDGGTR